MGGTQRFWFEDSGEDFPFYDGKPVAISLRRWSLVLAALAIGFLLLALPTLLRWGLVGRLAAGIGFCAVPLLGLAAVAGRCWTALLRRVGLRGLVLMWFFACLAFAAAVPAALLTLQVTQPTPSPAFGMLAGSSWTQVTLVLLGVMPQLAAEELLTILPFLAMLTALHGQGIPRKRAVAVAWIASTLLFAACHLPTYRWNIVQCLLIVGSARLVLTMAYLKTKNLWISLGAHALIDWGTIVTGLLTGAAASAAS